MQKKIIAFITSLCIVITCSAPSYAIDISSPSAISLSPSRFSSQANSAPSSTLASTDTYVVPSSSSDSIYYFSGTNTSSALQSVNTWANLAKAISYSIANSILNLSSQLKSAISSQTTSINAGLTNVENAVDDVWTRLGVMLGSVDQLEGYVDGLEGYLNSISGSVDGLEGKLDTNNTSLSNIKSDTANIYSLLNSGALDTVKVADNPDNGFSQDYLWKKYDTASGSVGLPNFQMDGSTQSTSWSWRNHSALESIEYLMYFSLTNDSRLARQLVQGWTTDGAYLTNSDLTTSNMKTSGTSIFSDMRLIGTNLSSHLARLAYVLASDEEIEARQAAANNQSTAVDNFIKPSGSASASAADIGEMANVSSNLSDMLGSNVSPSTAFSSMHSDSDAWSWFSQENADSLDQRTSNRRLLKNNNHSYVSDYYKELESIIGIKLW